MEYIRQGRSQQQQQKGRHLMEITTTMSKQNRWLEHICVVVFAFSKQPIPCNNRDVTEAWEVKKANEVPCQLAQRKNAAQQKCCYPSTMMAAPVVVQAARSLLLFERFNAILSVINATVACHRVKTEACNDRCVSHRHAICRCRQATVFQN